MPFEGATAFATCTAETGVSIEGPETHFKGGAPFYRELGSKSLLTQSMLPKSALVSPMRRRKNIAFGNISRSLLLHTKNKISLTVHLLFCHASNASHGSADHAAPFGSMGLIFDSNDATRWPGAEIQISHVIQNSNCFEGIKDRPSRVRQPGWAT